MAEKHAGAREKCLLIISRSKQTSLEEGKVERKKGGTAEDSMAIQIVRIKTLYTGNLCNFNNNCHPNKL